MNLKHNLYRQILTIVLIMFALIYISIAIILPKVLIPIYEKNIYLYLKTPLDVVNNNVITNEIESSIAYIYQKDNIIKVDITKYDSGMHVNQKPVKLMELLISLVTKENAVILDPFVGSGTTCVAAKNTNRHYIGIDIDPNNTNIANKRLLDECYQFNLN